MSEDEDEMNDLRVRLETMTPEELKVLESRWFRRGELPEIPRKGSIARQMIDAWNGEAL